MKYPRLSQQFSTKPIWGICALLSLPLFLGQSAVAGTITFNDLGVPFITDTTGGRVTGSCTISEVCTVTLLAPTGTAGANFTSPVNIFEDNSLTVVSDTFRFTSVGSTTIMQFISDPTESGLTPLPQPASFIVETGLLQQVGIVNWTLDAAHGGGTVTDTISFQSGEATTAFSPEPSGLILGGLGIALLALGRRRSTHA